MKLALRIIVVLIAAFFGCVGVGFMFFPALVVSSPAFALAPDGVAGLSTARSILGGPFLAMALLCLYGLRKHSPRILYALGLIVSFVAMGRALSLMADGFSATTIGGLVGETLVATALFAAGRLLPADH